MASQWPFHPWCRPQSRPCGHTNPAPGKNQGRVLNYKKAWAFTTLCSFLSNNRGIRAREVCIPIAALIRSEQDIKYFGEAMSQRLVSEFLNFT